MTADGTGLGSNGTVNAVREAFKIAINSLINKIHLFIENS